MKSFWGGEGQKMPWWTNTPQSRDGIFPEGVPDWVKQFMAHPYGHRDGESREGAKVPPIFPDLQKMGSQWPFTALGFDPFWMFHDSDGRATNKNARTRPQSSRRPRARRRL
ncbi:hypothetical protein KKP3000_000109 [Alicyclobacillus fastidiosus]|uniref:Uncharacterized protein n=2 Tax=Alicyclobacillus fastidiosus TaxID=392011 RepID=A0ABV5AGE3_9BACL